MPLSQETFAALVMEDSDSRWEIHKGKLREKPTMTVFHNEAISRLIEQILPQLPKGSFRIRSNSAHLTLGGDVSYIPDLVLVPRELVVSQRLQRLPLETYVEPMPFVVETWSPSTGGYDVNAKIPGYQRRGDAEIWRIHPFQETVTAWRREPDGSYSEQLYRAGQLALYAIPGVVVDLDDLFAED